LSLLQGAKAPNATMQRAGLPEECLCGTQVFKKTKKNKKKIDKIDKTYGRYEVERYRNQIAVNT
jgi:hypothetical protein